jgi:hypothetical protein
MRCGAKRPPAPRGFYLYVASEDTDVSSNLHPYQVDPPAMIDQIMTDPRQSAADAERTRSEIREETLYRGDIVRSLLYAPPPRLSLTIKLPTSLRRRRREKNIPEYDNGIGNVPMAQLVSMPEQKQGSMKAPFRAFSTPIARARRT